MKEMFQEFKNDKKMIVYGVLGAIGFFALTFVVALIQYVYFL
jgi:hypothetical protein